MELSIIIPGRNEEFLSRTIEDILEHTGEKTEIIAVLDGAWSNPPIPKHPRVNVIYVPESIGQRAATDLGVRLSKAKYVAKVDAHCSFDDDFDTKMLAAFEKNGDNCIIVPVMKNLHAFDWKCYRCGKKTYQDAKPTTCADCGKGDKLRKKMVWEPRRGVNSVSYSFDSEPHFHYFEDYKHREPYLTDKKTGFTETMSLQGSFFMTTRENYWKWDLGGDYGSWGNQGVQVACAAWLTGGRVLVNHNTWYSHMFRTKADFGFPYPQSGKHVSRTKKRVWETIVNGKLHGQKYPVSWLIERFSPVPGWGEEELKALKASEKV
jgi:ribosomal protein L37E